MQQITSHYLKALDKESVRTQLFSRAQSKILPDQQPTYASLQKHLNELEHCINRLPSKKNSKAVHDALRLVLGVINKAQKQIARVATIKNTDPRGKLDNYLRNLAHAFSEIDPVVQELFKSTEQQD
ncbi:hypothetical protein NHP21005_10320 [Helicobacter sp. NHP21005]|uniref:hypothetical protein n=1 Tax=Helicobacter felistomachi TaxID=3040201 RepID=UPI0025722783|nr:hypothetical protein [Helicobacter sp. NHP21005]BEG57344.1 hypothetical protein NHP21005_10320 [Helicobacter sp. NHP21005]